MYLRYCVTVKSHFFSWFRSRLGARPNRSLTKSSADGGARKNNWFAPTRMNNTRNTDGLGRFITRSLFFIRAVCACVQNVEPPRARFLFPWPSRSVFYSLLITRAWLGRYSVQQLYPLFNYSDEPILFRGSRLIGFVRAISTDRPDKTRLRHANAHVRRDGTTGLNAVTCARQHSITVSLARARAPERPKRRGLSTL